MNAKTLIAAALVAAFAGSAFAQSEASAAPVATSTLTRAQVLAEAREAQRLGVLGADEAEVRVATPAQQELIHAASLRALDHDVAHAAQ